MRTWAAAFTGLLVNLVAAQAWAGVCDYKPSALLGSSRAAAVGSAAAGASAAGIAAQAAGFYTLTNATTGLTMLGSTLAGSSAAGTIGIIGGTGGAIGTAAAVIMAPATIIAGAVTAAGLGAWEGACVFEVDRITDYDQVLAVMESLAEQADPAAFHIGRTVEGRTAIFVADGDAISVHPVDELYIADGVLKHRDWFMNTTIGAVDWVELVPDQD